MTRTARWAATVGVSMALMVGGATAASAGDWEQDDYSGWTPWSSSSPVAPATPSKAPKAPKAHKAPKPAANEDEPGWSCATQGNRVCGPGVGPNTGHDHSVYYGTGALPYIPGHPTTRPDDTSDGPRCLDSVFVELGYAVPAGTTVGECS